MRLALRSGGGYSLLEVLVAVFVLAVGIVGAAATQLAALRTRHQSALMSNAVQLASSVADSMRANADAGAVFLNLDYDAAGGAPPAGPQCLPGAACSAAQMAQAELSRLKSAVHAGFPGGRVVVCRDSQAWDAARGALRWTCTGAAPAPVVIKLGWRGKDTDGRESRDRAGDFAPSVAIAVPGAAE
ncbi:MAG: type IV pilus modification protein PilV [Pseudomonadota bacterium]